MSENPIAQNAEFFHLLGHPLRIALLQYLASVPQATATECAPVVGASPSTCSWHLRMLAKGGFVEPVAAGDGRLRPWRYIGPLHLELSNEEVPSILQYALLRQDRHVVEQFLQHRDQYPLEWRESPVFIHSVLRLDPPQLKKLEQEIQTLMAQYNSLVAEDVSSSSGRVYTAFYAVPWFKTATDGKEKEQ